MDFRLLKKDGGVSAHYDALELPCRVLAAVESDSSIGMVEFASICFNSIRFSVLLKQQSNIDPPRPPHATIRIRFF
jgi:hypothetical protein